MVLTLRLREESGATYLAEARQNWEEGQKGEISTATLLRLVAEAGTGTFLLRGEWRRQEAAEGSEPELERSLVKWRSWGRWRQPRTAA